MEISPLTVVVSIGGQDQVSVIVRALFQASQAGDVLARLAQFQQNPQPFFSGDFLNTYQVQVRRRMVWSSQSVAVVVLRLLRRARRPLFITVLRRADLTPRRAPSSRLSTCPPCRPRPQRLPPQ